MTGQPASAKCINCILGQSGFIQKICIYVSRTSLGRCSFNNLSNSESNVSMPNNNSTKNIFLQAKRASKLLDIPLTKAKDLIANSIYQCHNYEDLLNKLANNSLKASVYPFCKVHPNSGIDAQSHIEKNLDTIAKRFKKFLNVSVEKIPLFTLIWRIFGLQNQSSINQVFPHISLENWQLYPPLSSEENPTSYYDIKINNVPFRILATRIITSCMFTDNSLNELLTLKSEFSKFKFPPIMWSDWKHWQDKALLSFNSIGLGNGPQQPIFEKLAEPKCDFQKTFQDRLYESISALSEEFVGTNIRYCEFDQHMFYIIGFPINNESSTLDYLDIYLTNEHVKNGKCLFNFEDNLLALELFEINNEGEFVGDYDDYYKALSCSLQEFEEAMRKIIVIDGKQYEAYMRPCTLAEYAIYKTTAITLIDDLHDEQKAG